MLPGGNDSIAMKAKLSRFQPITNPRQIFLHPSASSPTKPTQEQEENLHLNIPVDDTFSPSSPSAVAVASEESLVTKILLKLPPKPLLRSQCVSKQWLSLISDPAFRRQHARAIRTHPTSDLLFFSPDSERNEIDLISLSPEGVDSVGNVSSPITDGILKRGDEIHSLHSCNGLLCMQIKLKNNRLQLIVYNPTTCKHRVIPWFSGDYNMPIFRYANIAFDPSKSDHYKLVCFGLDRDSDCNNYRFLIYSSETGAWRVTEDAVGTLPVRYYYDRGVLWNGDFHWFGTNYCTLCFDVQKERLKPSTPQIPASFGVRNKYDIWYFGEAGGDLSVMCVNKLEAMLFDVFALKRDYSQWILKHRVDFAPLTRYYPKMKGPGFHTPCLVVDEEGKKARIVISVEDKFLSYDIADMVVKELVEVGPVYAEVAGWGDSTWYRWYEAFQHVDTLASV
ncbi:F-box protein At5g07610-like [Coffea eugenioides]|uniref:F-box protein At5g07610-like n=1 Tax=Coffea eugenioides TaxID=49369 RepID=UPI000F60CCD4|nr:F-box protein At5g07610-like [Coffea eugenioides]